MSQSSQVLDRAFTEAKRLCYAGLDEVTLLQRVTERTQQVVPFECHCVHTNDPASGLITRAVLYAAELEKLGPIFLERVYFEDEVTPYGWMAKKRLLAITLSKATGGRPECALRYPELFTPLRLEHELRGAFAQNGELWGSFAFMRERGSLDFTDPEVEFFRRIAPHVTAGLKVAALRTEALAEPGKDNIPGVLVLDHKGRVVQHTWAAEQWLHDLGELGQRWQEGYGLPAAVVSVAGALKRALGPETDRERHGIARLLARTRSGRWLALHGAQSEPSATRESETTIIIEPARPRELFWLRTSAYSLSEREREIVDLIVRGLSTEEISKTLYISEYTVQDHLSNVFDKVGVRGRRALVKHLYLESLFGKGEG
jgi:DNA-binding CsgD family transcriptional regulator